MRCTGVPDKNDVDELTKEFIAESVEGLDRMDRCLTELELRPQDGALLGEIFRAVHTIKGTTGFLGFQRLERLAHAGETLLGSLRDGRLRATAELVNGLLKLMDGLRSILLLIERVGHEGDRAADEDAGLIQLMVRLNAQDQDADDCEVLAPVWAETVAGAAGVVTATEKTLRIDVDVLNRMMNLVGELVLTRNQILESHVKIGMAPVLARRLDNVTAELRETVMQARMQPVGHLFSKFPRLVRDIAKSCGKKVRLEFYGQETALDKGLLEALKDPLTHALRNAVDHGIEKPEARRAAGKAEEGLLTVKAWHQSGSVVVELSDDGGGIATERVLQKAVERKLVTEAEAAGMSAKDALQLIFLPGFSTAEAVTMVSGRGVGMDVVRANVEKVGGVVELDSKPGAGTVLRLRVPLTLAIVPALVVESGGQSFCLPQSALAELVYVPLRDREQCTERMGDVELFRLREKLLPMIWLDELLGIGEGGATRPGHGFYLAVLEAEGFMYGLVVDDLRAPQEIVVKPLSTSLQALRIFSGATVLGNGSLALILDVPATGARAGVKPVAEEVRQRAMEGQELSVKRPGFLVFEEACDGRSAGRKALPIEMVERIEDVAVSAVEYAGRSAVLQYRGELLPLEDAGGVLERARAFAQNGQEHGLVTVLICWRNGVYGAGQRVGMVVERVVEVTEGLILKGDRGVCEEQLALVNERLTVVCRRDVHEPLLKEVA